MTWSIRFRMRQWLRGSLWVVPVVGGLLGVLVGALSVVLDRRVTVPASWQYSPGTASTLLSAVVGSMVALIGFVVTISVLVVQMATGTFSARYMRLWYRDRVLKAVLAWLLGTLTFAYWLLRRTDTGNVPNIGVSVVGSFVIVGLTLFLLFLDRFVHRLRPVAVATIVAAAGRSTFERSTATVSDADLAVVGERPALAVPATEAGVIQAVDRDGLVRFADRHDAVLVLPHAVGDFVSRGTTLIQAHGDGLPGPARRDLLGMVALGVERTIEQDAAFAIRIMVDVANKALSAAINDPTTAIQVLNEIGDTLGALGRVPKLTGITAFGGRDGRVRVLMPAHRFEDMLSLGVTEIREYGAASVQVMRRLRALLEDLRESVLDEYAPLVDEQLARLDATVAASWGDRVDHDLARVADRQGIGGPRMFGKGT
ncbi:MAG TPA: DUF2254 domain-containing protein [Gaiellaceae bacterium]